MLRCSLHRLAARSAAPQAASRPVTAPLSQYEVYTVEKQDRIPVEAWEMKNYSVWNRRTMQRDYGPEKRVYGRVQYPDASTGFGILRNYVHGFVELPQIMIMEKQFFGRMIRYFAIGLPMFIFFCVQHEWYLQDIEFGKKHGA